MQRKYLITTLIIMAFIFVQSALPGDLSSNESNFIVQLLVALFDVDAGSVGFAVRKCAHFTEYLVLGGSTMLLFGEMRLSGLIAWAVGAAYAVTDEFHQLFVAGRSCEVRDMCIDAAGVLCGVMVVWLWGKRREQTETERKGFG